MDFAIPSADDSLIARRSVLANLQTIVVKVGTNVLSTTDDRLDPARIQALAEQLAEIGAKGIKPILVSSGAIGAGMALLGLKTRPKDLPHLQAAAAVGQAQLMHTYDEAFRPHGYHAAQLLLTANDFKNRARYLNMRNTLLTLAEYQTIPVVNENDTVSVDEIKLGDNDRLAAMVAGLLQADLLIILSVVDGLLTGDPTLATSQRIPFVTKFDDDLLSLVGATKSSRGTGGMKSKLEAVRTAVSAGTNVIIGHGQHPNILRRILSGEDVGTLFQAESSPVSAWKRWIGYTLAPKGKLFLDDGAVRAVTQQGKSLLAIGVSRVQGEFAKGEVVSLLNSAGEEIARGLTNYDSQAATLVAGKRTEEMLKTLGTVPYDEVIHRDNLALTSPLV